MLSELDTVVPPTVYDKELQQREGKVLEMQGQMGKRGKWIQEKTDLKKKNDVNNLILSKFLQHENWTITLFIM